MNNKPYFIALNRMFLSPRNVAKIWQHWPDLKSFFSLSSIQLEEAGFNTKLAKRISNFDLNQVTADINWAQQPNHHLLTWEDADYPALLKEIADPPIVLYAKGDLSCLQQATVAMVGSRKPTISGQDTAKQFAFNLALKRITIVSGLALGVDSQAHQGCLAAGGKTIAVMATGIDMIYPHRNRSLAEKISENGLLITEFPLQTSPIARHFPQRNRIISGLSLCTLVVEAAMRSGSLITARLALEQNRDVLAIPGSIYNPQVAGCHYLLQQGAKLVMSSEDVLEEIGMRDNTEKVVQTLSIADQNGILVNCIGYEITTVDQMMERSGLAIDTVLGHLANLELKGLVKSVPGGYMRCSL